MLATWLNFNQGNQGSSSHIPTSLRLSGGLTLPLGQTLLEDHGRSGRSWTVQTNTPIPGSCTLCQGNVASGRGGRMSDTPKPSWDTCLSPPAKNKPQVTKRAARSSTEMLGSCWSGWAFQHCCHSQERRGDGDF